MPEPVAVFDGHNDFLLRLLKHPAGREALWPGPAEGGHMDLPRMRAGGFAGGLFAIFVPPVSDGPPPDFAKLTAQVPYDIPLPPLMRDGIAQPVAMAMAGLLHWMARTAPDDFAVCTSVAEIRAAMAAGRIAGVMHMEGAEAIDPELEALERFHKLGLRSLGPVWSRPTVFGHGVPMKFPGDPDTGDGLTDEGKALVRECNRLGIMLDLSHMNEKGFDDVAALSDAPLVASHSNAHALCASPRNLTDRQLDMIRETGGLVGLNFATFYLRPDGTGAPDMGWEPVLRQVDYLIGRLGEAHVGLGSDFDGCILPDAIGDVAGLPALVEALRAHGYGEALIAGLARENWLGCLERVWGG